MVKSETDVKAPGIMAKAPSPCGRLSPHPIFCVDGWRAGYFGFAKTSNAVLQAFKYICSNLDSIFTSQVSQLAYQFIWIDDVDESRIPLLQYVTSTVDDVC